MAPRKFDCYMVAISIGTHPKLGELKDGEFRAHVAGVLAVAAMAPVRGCLLVGNLPAEAAHIARAAGVPEKVARSAMDKLRAVGILEPDESHDCLRVHDWEDYNPPPRTDATNAERQAKHRAKLKTDVTDESNGRNALRNGEKERYGPLRNGESGVTVTNSPLSPLSPPDPLSPPLPPSEGEGEVGNPPYPPKGGTREVHQDVLRLCGQLAARMVANDPKAKPAPDSDRWQRDMRLLLQDRQGDVAEVERIIDWCQHDPFWQSNILSPAKLRKQFTQLLLRSQQPSSVVAIHQRPNASEMLRAINGGAA